MKTLKLLIVASIMLFQANIIFAQGNEPSDDSNYYKDWVGQWYEVIDGKTNEFPSFVVRKSLYYSSFEKVWMQGKGGHYCKAWRAWDGRTKKWNFAWISTDGLFQL